MSDTTKVTDEEIEEWKARHDEESLAGLEWGKIDEIMTKLLRVIDELKGENGQLHSLHAEMVKDHYDCTPECLLCGDSVEKDSFNGAICGHCADNPSEHEQTLIDRAVKAETEVGNLKKEIAGRREEKKKLKARDILAMNVLEELEVRIDRISIRRDLWKIAAKKYKTLHAYCPPYCWSCGDYIHAEPLGAVCGECADDPTRREAELKARAEKAERELEELRDDGGES